MSPLVEDTVGFHDIKTHGTPYGDIEMSFPLYGLRQGLLHVIKTLGKYPLARMKLNQWTRGFRSTVS
jgi:hypothetical protein